MAFLSRQFNKQTDNWKPAEFSGQTAWGTKPGPQTPDPRNKTPFNGRMNIAKKVASVKAQGARRAETRKKNNVRPGSVGQSEPWSNNELMH